MASQLGSESPDSDWACWMAITRGRLARQLRCLPGGTDRTSRGGDRGDVRKAGAVGGGILGCGSAETVTNARECVVEPDRIPGECGMTGRGC